MYNKYKHKSQGSWGIPNKSKYEQKYNNFRFSFPKAATDMGVSSSESHDLTWFYETLMAGFGALLEIWSTKAPWLQNVITHRLKYVHRGDFTWVEMRRKLPSHSTWVWLYITDG